MWCGLVGSTTSARAELRDAPYLVRLVRLGGGAENGVLVRLLVAFLSQPAHSCWGSIGQECHTVWRVVCSGAEEWGRAESFMVASNCASQGTTWESLQVLISASVTMSLVAMICTFLTVCQRYVDNAEQG